MKQSSEHKNRPPPPPKKKSSIPRYEDRNNSFAVVGGRLSRHMPLFPVKMQAMLTYNVPFAVITGTSTSAGSLVFSANGLYDPDITGTGHQPIGFDQLMLFYNHYVVTTSKIIVQGINLSSTPACISVNRSADNTPLTFPSQIVENGNLKYCILPRVECQNDFNTMSIATDIAKFGGVDDIMDSAVYRGNVNNNPGEGSFYHVQVWSPLSSAATVNVSMMVTIEYDAWFIEPKPVPQS